MCIVSAFFKDYSVAHPQLLAFLIGLAYVATAIAVLRRVGWARYAAIVLTTIEMTFMAWSFFKFYTLGNAIGLGEMDRDFSGPTILRKGLLAMIPGLMALYFLLFNKVTVEAFKRPPI